MMLLRLSGRSATVREADWHLSLQNITDNRLCYRACVEIHKKRKENGFAYML
ncbi:hypothetical protein MKC48_18360 [[Clostridium] innocuum]|nr:hypothetical protein [Erysipelotrichaceae bacterium]MCR0625788.1 hypothetical protein [[Clostridium] innocuum]